MGRHRHRSRIFTAAAVGLSLLPAAARAQMEETSVALPVVSLTFSFHYLADDLGLFEKHGLKVKTSVVSGIGAANAVLAGSVDFSSGSGPTVIRANARGQKLVAIGLTVEKPTLEVVLSKDVAAKRGIDDKMPMDKRAQAVKGLQLAIDGPNTIPHGYMKYFLAKGQVSDQRDVTLTPMQPPNMLAALKSGAIAGFVMSQPWTLIPVREGNAIRLASSIHGDFPELVPFAFNVIMTRAGNCEQKPAVCRKLMAAYQAALTLIRDKPAEALPPLQKRFAQLDPGVVVDAFEAMRSTTPKSLEITEAGLKNAQELMVVTGMVKPEETLKSFDGIYSNKYLQ
jgi:ABC-type nitrate/sulfonate/bicarbonate transport system substrate-binding protein